MQVGVRVYMADLKQNQNEKKMSSFLKRLLSGAILLLCILLVVPMGGLPLFFLTLCISLLGLYELYRVFGIEKRSIGYIGYITVLMYYLLVWFQIEEYLTLMIILSLMGMFAFYVITYPEYQIDHVAKAFLSVVYAGIMMSYLFQTRYVPDGRIFIWLIFIASWGSDTCAYCSGMLLGKHKMTPNLSPKKTVEGAIGGVLGSAILGALFAFLFRRYFTEVASPVLTSAIACAVGALISMIGDLTASGIKRDYTVKDYGNLIPGHGGIMDRFDSVIFTAPAVYFALSFII